jgi:hypothetical protein
LLIDLIDIAAKMKQASNGMMAVDEHKQQSMYNKQTMSTSVSLSILAAMFVR